MKIVKAFFVGCLCIFLAQPAFSLAPRYAWVMTFKKYVLNETRAGTSETVITIGYVCGESAKDQQLEPATLRKYNDQATSISDNSHFFRNPNLPNSVTGFSIRPKNVGLCSAYFKIGDVDDKKIPILISLQDCMEKFEADRELKICPIMFEDQGIALFAQLERAL